VSLLVTIPAAAGLLMAGIGLFRVHRVVQGTTLMTAWGAALILLTVWGVVWAVGNWGPSVSDGLLSRFCYSTAVLGLCPPVAVLGARKPVSRAWAAFVLIPLLLVFSIPAVSTWWRHGPDTALQLEAPMLIGFLLVLVMGAGNYVGTRFTWAALAYAAAVATVILPATDFAETLDAPPVALVNAAAILLGMSGWAAIRAGRRANLELPHHDRLWIAFRDAFGIVWATRVMQRINWTAREENWPAELDFTGLRWTETKIDADEKRRVIERLIHTYRWLLKRFVNDEWIDIRLG